MKKIQKLCAFDDDVGYGFPKVSSYNFWIQIRFLLNVPYTDLLFPTGYVGIDFVIIVCARNIYYRFCAIYTSYYLFRWGVGIYNLT